MGGIGGVGFGSPHAPKLHPLGRQWPLPWAPPQEILVHRMTFQPGLRPVLDLQSSVGFVRMHTTLQMHSHSITVLSETAIA